MSRKACSISLLELSTLITASITKHRIYSLRSGEGPFKQVAKDLKKVEFNFENWEDSPYHEFNLLGPQQIGDLSCFVMLAGGDWEYPVHFVLYMDKNKKTLRAYIPEAGNAYNKTTKKAFGNDEDNDPKDIRKQLKKYFPEKQFEKDFVFEYDDCDLVHSNELMLKDIQQRIQVVN